MYLREDEIKYIIYWSTKYHLLDVPTILASWNNAYSLSPDIKQFLHDHAQTNAAAYILMDMKMDR